jgi:hypothetical protein
MHFQKALLVASSINGGHNGSAKENIEGGLRSPSEKPSTIQKGKQQHPPIPSPPALSSPERADRNRRPISHRSEVGPARAQRPIQPRFSRQFLAGKDNRRAILTSLPFRSAVPWAAEAKATAA